MLVIRLWNYFRGYVIIRIEGLTLEKFINLSIAKGLYLWDIQRIDYTTLEAKIGIKGFKSLKDIVRRVGCRTHIIEKRGYPFLAHKFKYRKMFGLGFILSIGLIFFATSYVWKIDVEGNERVKDEAIVIALERMEVKTWIPKRRIDTLEIKQHLLANLDSLAYAGAEVKGTKLIITVKERDVIPEIISSNEPCNIVANKRAVVYKVIAKNGKGIVNKGDIVQEGQVLITGSIEDERLEKPLLVHSEGSVIGTTWYNETINEPIIKTIKEETGEIHSTKEIQIGKKRIHLMSGDIPFEHYIQETKSEKLIKVGFIDIPINTIEHIYKEVEIKEIEQNVDSLKQILAVLGVEKIMERVPLGAEVVSKEVTNSITDGVLTTKIDIEVREEIGVKQKIH